MIWHSFFFALFAALACGFALAVVLTSNVVRMAFYLVLSLSATAGLYFLAGADFVGSMQLMIYVGGTLVLLIFGVMLTAQEEFIRISTRPAEVALAAMVGLALLILLSSAAFRVPAWRGDTPAERSLALTPQTVGPIAMALLGLRVDQAPPTADSPPNDRPGYVLIFEIISVHLLVVLVGAAYLARGRIGANSLVRQDPSQPASDLDDLADADPSGSELLEASQTLDSPAETGA
ncbi:NADH-quinone oxidoreductase subunit J family protein [Botrimarina hoheduenensis]|uniref:NADH-quinone oxidoreductase subunit J n=1 Tax=Botrimarina hoheduenensis TaxID=2528000 RepID=A0A5C5WEP4_9BACT|nr:NADH-quinone oxidoreductase subunit J [Botrimarina hoheduenensis]TWT48525.1 NADH-quinone oxidoreductase subunit J [Botrimarina hoheduenensis]